MTIELSEELKAWLRKNKSKSVQAAVDTDFNQRTFRATRMDAGDPIEDGDAGAANP